jgi:chitodextrinase
VDQCGLSFCDLLSCHQPLQNRSLAADSLSVQRFLTLLLAISGLTGTQATLAWPDASDDGSLTGYRVYKNGPEIGTVGNSTNSLTVSGLTPATTYAFEVRAADSSGNQGPALAASAATPDTIAPTWGSSAELKVTSYGETYLTLEWKGAVDNVGVTGYLLSHGLTSDLAASGFVASEVVASAASATVTGLKPGQSYLFEVQAGDAAGNWSDKLAGVFRTLGWFNDIAGHLFYNDILWMANEGITRGCNPPVNDLFCPDHAVTRETMAAFLVRALGLTENDHSGFEDVVPGSTFANDIGKLATAGITKGCNPPANDRFCPKDAVTRETMAAFLVRAFELTQDTHPGFKDVSASSIFANDIGRLATAGITKGCNPPANDLFCPGDVVTRGQLAAFLHRADP